MPIDSTENFSSPRGIGPVTQKWIIGARLYLSMLKQMEDSVALRESAFVEREYRGARQFKNVALPVLTDVQKSDPEVQAGFAAMLSDNLAVQLGGTNHTAKHIRALLKTAEVINEPEKTTTGYTNIDGISRPAVRAKIESQTSLLPTEQPKQSIKSGRLSKTDVVIERFPRQRLISNTEYARMIGVTTRTLYSYEAKGILTPSKIINGRKYRDPNELPRFDTEPSVSARSAKRSG